MAYDKKQRVRYNLPVFDFGGGAALTYAFRAPYGMKGKIVDIGVATTEIFACDTTDASVAIGTAADADAYALLEIPDGTADDDCFDITDDTDAIISATIDKSTVAATRIFVVTLTNGTDATAVTGQGLPYFDIEWW